VDIFTNAKSENWTMLSKPMLSRSNSKFQVNLVSRSELTVTEKKLYIPWLLTWSHKNKMKNDILSGNPNSLFLYLEDDAIFTSDNLDYFLNNVPILEKIGLIPGFIRAEWSNLHRQWINPDIFSAGSIKPSFSVEGSDYKFSQRENPYSASILLNLTQGHEYIASDSFQQDKAWKKHPIIFDIGSTAALGLIAEGIPKGYINRVAIPVNPINENPIPGCVIRHQGDRYGNDVWQGHYTIFGDHPGRKLISKRKLKDYLLRILKRDFLLVSRKFFMRIFKQ
jgi:hypothetical protein